MNRSFKDPTNKHSVHHPVDESSSITSTDRAPFNDVIKHGDIIQGFQSPKQITQFPKWYQNPKRIFATISVLIFVSMLVYQLIRFILNVAG